MSEFMSKTKKNPLEVMRENLRKAAEKSGMTQEEIGVAMGFSKASARQAVSRLLNPESELDPRFTTLAQFAEAVNCSLAEIVS
jgi:transcriptional regulator with XRE-family HTH domain